MGLKNERVCVNKNLLFIFTLCMIAVVVLFSQKSAKSKIISQSKAAPAPIISGSAVPIEEKNPTLLLMNSESNKICSGVLIHPRWFLTAAHCLTEMNIQQAFGDVKDINDEEQMKKLNALAYDARYIYGAGTDQSNQISYTSDIALFHLLPNRVKEDRYELPYLATETSEGYLYKVSNEVTGYGFGLSYDESDPVYGKLYSAKFIIGALDRGWGTYFLIFQNNKNKLPRKAAGDSGGPDFIRDRNGKLILVGIHNGEAFSDNGKPPYDVSTNISDFTPWIVAIMNKYGDQPNITGVNNTCMSYVTTASNCIGRCYLNHRCYSNGCIISDKQNHCVSCDVQMIDNIITTSWLEVDLHKCNLSNKILK